MTDRSLPRERSAGTLPAKDRNRCTTTLGGTTPASLQGRPQPARPLIPLTPPLFCFKYHSFKRFTHKRYRPKTLKIDTAATTAVTLPLQPSPALGASPHATGPFCNNAAQPDNVTSLYKEEAGEMPFVVLCGGILMPNQPLAAVESAQAAIKTIVNSR